MSDSDQKRGTHHLVEGSENGCSDHEQPSGEASSAPLILMVGPNPRATFLGAMPVIRVERLSEALSFLDQNTATAIVTDLDLPDSSGISTLQRLQSRADFCPVVVLIGETEEERSIALKALENGASAYLPRRAATVDVLGPLVESVIVATRSSADIRRCEARLRVAVDGAGDGLWEWNLQTEEFYCSPRCSTILGFSAEETIDSPNRWLDRVHPDDLPHLRTLLHAHLEGNRGSFECEHRLLNGFADPHWILARGRAVRDLHGRVTSIAGFLMDITDRRRNEEQAIHKSLHDGLTGLANRGLFIDRVERALLVPDRDGGADLSVLFVDLDHFKRVNDLYGHGAGDQVLIEVARRLESVLRPGDTVARLGGDEFGILLMSSQGAELSIHVAERVLNLVSQPVAVGKNEMVVRASIGIATNDAGYQDAASIIDAADLAMYRANSRGRSRDQVRNPQMHESAVSRINLETELRLAVDDHQFEMHYQPIVDLDSGRVAGVEAMVRWLHPERGMLTPAQFIDVAESSGLIVPLGLRVLEDACKQVVWWRRNLPEAEQLFLSVNLSLKILVAEGMLKRLERTLEETGLPASALVLEFPEAVILDNADQVKAPLEKLRNLGIRLAIDDFGLEHGSISQLDRKIFDTLKLDPTITERVNGVSSGDRLPPSLISIAAELGVEVVAEGVETSEQLEALCGLGCRMAQGFWFATPARAETVEGVIARPPQWWTNPRGVWKSWQQH
ncbi:MAG: diguanylate cyclase [Acidobacteria bacterium]|nr:MAG: diguanylate cyclase [Acidobacteriota bacterium]